MPGQIWDIEIMQALRRADFIIILLSNISVEKRGYVQKEFKLALEYIEEKLDTDIYIIPCKIDNCETPNKLNKYQWISLTDNYSFEKILTSLNTQRSIYKAIERKKILSHASFEYETISKAHEVGFKPRSSIKIDYPKFKDVLNESLNEINSIIEGSVINEYINGREIIISSTEEQEKVEKYFEYEFTGYSITISCEFTLLSKNFISIVSNSYYNTGGIRGNYASQGYNYVLNPLRELYLLTEDSILEYVSSVCRKYIIDKIEKTTGTKGDEKDYFLNEEPLQPDIGNFKNFFLDKKGVNFIFNPYEVTAYTLGQHIIPVPYINLLNYTPDSEALKILI